MFDNLPQTGANPAAITAAQLITLVLTWTDLPDARRRALVSVLTRAAKIMGLPPDALRLTPDTVRRGLPSGSAMVFGLKASSYRTVLSGVRFAMRRAGIIDYTDTPLSPAWLALLNLLPPEKRPALIAFARRCSAIGVDPLNVDEAVFRGFHEWLAERTLTTRPTKLAGATRSAWNRAAKAIADWPGQKLAVLRLANSYILPLGDFTADFQASLEAYGRRLAGADFDERFEDMNAAELEGDGALPIEKPCRPSTIESKLGHCRWAASALVATGTVAISDIRSLRDLVTPVDRARATLSFLYQLADKKPTPGAGHVAQVLRAIAKFDARLSDDDVQSIRRWGKRVQLTYTCMTKKNASTMRQMQQPDAEARFLALPSAYMALARAMRESDPADAARKAMRAAVICLLTSAPLRLKNLTGLRLDEHLQRDNPPKSAISRISIAVAETKNSRVISLPISPRVAAVLQEWIDDFRPLVAQPGSTFLFPGYAKASRPISHQSMRDAVKLTLTREVGVVMTPQQFRHFAALTFLSEHPGHYAEVQQLLGHKTLQTTIKSYCGLESETSVVRFDAIIAAKIADLKPARSCKPKATKSSTRSRMARRGKEDGGERCSDKWGTR